MSRRSLLFLLFCPLSRFSKLIDSPLLLAVIVITMYSVRPCSSFFRSLPRRFADAFVLTLSILVQQENEVLFLRTLYGVMKNISHLCKRTNSSFWGKDGWKKVRFRSRPSPPPFASTNSAPLVRSSFFYRSSSPSSPTDEITSIPRSSTFSLPWESTEKDS